MKIIMLGETLVVDPLGNIMECPFRGTGIASNMSNEKL